MPSIVSGIVQDSKTGLPLVSASVVNESTGGGVTTESNGSFQLDANSTDDNITISYVGYATFHSTAGTMPDLISLDVADDSFETATVTAKIKRVSYVALYIILAAAIIYAIIYYTKKGKNG